MANGILAQSYMDLPGTPIPLATTIRYLIVIFNPMANFDFECFRKKVSRRENPKKMLDKIDTLCIIDSD